MTTNTPSSDDIITFTINGIEDVKAASIKLFLTNQQYEMGAFANELGRPSYSDTAPPACVAAGFSERVTCSSE